MDKGIRNTLLGIFAFMGVILGTFFYTFLSHHALTEKQYKELGYFPFHPARPIGQFSLVNTNGKQVDHGSLVGHWSLLYFGYTKNPDVDPTTLSVLSRAMKQLGKPPRVIMVTVDPSYDTPARMKKYLASFDKSFIGYTGTFHQVVQLAQEVNISFGKVPGSAPGDYRIRHSTNIVVVDPAGKYAGFIRPGPKPDHVARVLSSLMHVPLHRD